MSGPVAIFLFFLLLLVDMFFYGFDAAIDNLNEKEILHKAEEEKDRRSMRLSEMIHGIVFYCHDLYPVDFRCADSPENGIQTAGEVGVCLY